MPAAAYGRVPLAFEPNAGRTDRRVAYLARGRGYTVFLTRKEAVLANPFGALPQHPMVLHRGGFPDGS